MIRIQYHICVEEYPLPYWVNPRKKGGMDGVFRGLAGLLRGIFRGRSPREIPSLGASHELNTIFFLGPIFQGNLMCKTLNSHIV